jgi:isopentenyl-diphosphate delta-isomerase
MINTNLLEDPVELVDDAGRRTGTMGELAAHRAPGERHRAFSVFLFDLEGRLLLQRRAPTKHHSPGRWSNSCTGHPRPGETPEEAARRRVAAELGVTPHHLAQAGTINYRLTEPMSGLVEHEHNHVFVGHVIGLPLPDPDDVADIAMVTAEELLGMLERESFSAWFEIVSYVAMTAAPSLLPQLPADA